MKDEISFVVFEGSRLRARGSVAEVVRALWPVPSARQADLRILNERTGATVDFDWRGEMDRVIERAEEQVLGPSLGRPKLGVSSREVTLLPRHWHWLDGQPGSASATIRKLIDEKMARSESGWNGLDGLYRQMSSLAGDLAGFEDAARYLYSGQWRSAEAIVAKWPGDLSTYFLARLRAVKKVSPPK